MWSTMKQNLYRFRSAAVAGAVFVATVALGGQQVT
jgi:hypothetical protein